MVSVLGFGLCRAWIIISLSLSFSALSFAGTKFTSSWIFLFAGAIAALALPLLFSSHSLVSKKTQTLLLRVTMIFLFTGAILIPAALLADNWQLLLVGWSVGGIGAGLLQVLWGERFASYPLRFSLIVAPAAAILTAILVALASSEANKAVIVGLFVFPVASYCLLLFEVDGTSFGKSLCLRQNNKQKTNHKLPKESADANVTAISNANATASSTTNVASNSNANAAAIAYASSTTNAASTSFASPLAIAVWKLMMSILVFSFICRSFDILAVEYEGIGASNGFSALLSLVIVGATFLILQALLKERFNVTLTYRLSLPLMMLGFAALAFFFTNYATVSLLLIYIGYEFFDVLSWILFGEIARRENHEPHRSCEQHENHELCKSRKSRKPHNNNNMKDNSDSNNKSNVSWGRNAYQIFSLGVGFTFMGMALAYFFGEFFVALFVHDETFVLGIVMLSMVALVFIAFFVVPEGTVMQLAGLLKTGAKDEQTIVNDNPFAADMLLGEHNNDFYVENKTACDFDPTTKLPISPDLSFPDLSTPDLAKPTFEDACASVAAEFSLTARESEALVLLARGRTLVIIARDLQIAKGTARTHIEHIYAKLGIHKQQELIDLVEQKFSALQASLNELFSQHKK
jgi:DNA-binding CsgD family transcriptional regulator